VQARQRACIDGARVSLIAFNEITAFETNSKEIKEMAACFVVCKEMGRISYVSGAYLFDEFSELKQLFGTDSSSGGAGDLSREGGIRLYNLNEGSWTLVRPVVEKTDLGSSSELLYSGGSLTF
jgi:hypothetical protein